MTQNESIKKRNARVEANKAWETSLTRRAVIAIGTYLIIGTYLTYLKIEQAWLHALVPATGYALSTLSLNLIKSIWMKRIYQHDNQ